MNRDYNSIVDALTDEDGEPLDGHVTLRFVGSKLIDGRPHALDDFKGTYTVRIEELHDEGEFWHIRRDGDSHYVKEELKTHPNAPDFAKDWDGPYTIMVHDIHPK